MRLVGGLLVAMLLASGCSAARDSLVVALEESASSARATAVAVRQADRGDTTAAVRSTVIDDALTTVTGASSTVGSGSGREAVRTAAGHDLADLAAVLRRLTSSPDRDPRATVLELEGLAERIERLSKTAQERT